MKKTISGDTVNLIMGIVYAVMIAFRITFFCYWEVEFINFGRGTIKPLQ